MLYNLSQPDSTLIPAQLSESSYSNQANENTLRACLEIFSLMNAGFASLCFAKATVKSSQRRFKPMFGHGILGMVALSASVWAKPEEEMRNCLMACAAGIAIYKTRFLVNPEHIVLI